MSQQQVPLLSVRNLTVAFGQQKMLRAVNGVSFDLSAGETLAIVGESGSGKTVTAMSILGLAGGHVTDGEIRFEGRDLAQLTSAEMRRVRGGRIGSIFQDPMSSLNPVRTIFSQISEMITIHAREMSAAQVRSSVFGLLQAVGIPEPESSVHRYPHEYSGGMRQRVMIAMAIANSPRLLIADEPTTALDVTIQAQVLRVLKDMQLAVGAGMIFISHDLALVSQVSDRVAVMYAGRIVEMADVASIFRAPQHPYTRGLLASLPSASGGSRRIHAIRGQAPALGSIPQGCSFHPRCELGERAYCQQARPELETGKEQDESHRVACHFPDGKPSERQVDARTGVDGDTAGKPRVVRFSRPTHGAERLRVEDLAVSYGANGAGLWRRQTAHRAVQDVNLVLHSGETLALVGESGCGKSTTARAIMGLVRPSAGRVLLDGQDIVHFSRSRMRPIRKTIQMVFQDPYASLNPRMTVASIISEPIRINGLLHGASLQERIEQLMQRVGLRPEHAARYPHEFSGGQRQRIAIARALSLDPAVLILDEPTSALDVSIQAQVINLLWDLQNDLGLSYLFISHDLGLVRLFADRVAVMRKGQIVEEGSTGEVFRDPQNAYTRELISAAPSLVAGSVKRDIHVAG